MIACEQSRIEKRGTQTPFLCASSRVALNDEHTVTKSALEAHRNKIYHFADITTRQREEGVVRSAECEADKRGERRIFTQVRQADVLT